MATIRDVAKIAGVSVATVSRVLNGQGKVGEACRKRVQKVIDEIGYRPNVIAKSLAKNASRTVGIVTPNLSMSFFGSLACGAEFAARECGYGMVMRNSLYETKSELSAIEYLCDHNCKSIVLHSEYSDEKTLIDLADKIPGLVLINRFVPQLSKRCVWLDNKSAASQSVDYLTDNGHRKFALLTSVYQNHDPGIRLQAVKERLAAKEIKLDPDLVVEATSNMEGGEQAVKTLLETGKEFTAIIAYNDLMAIGAINQLFEAGIEVPKDVSVIGFDDLNISKACRPPLTTMLYPIEKMASYATNLSLKLANNQNKDLPDTHLFMSELIERKSVAKV